jgi:hypothetical protein
MTFERKILLTGALKALHGADAGAANDLVRISSRVMIQQQGNTKK